MTMHGESAHEEDDGKLALDELYKDGRIPTLKELLEVINKHGLKLVNAKPPSDKEEENSEGKS
jgi:hypothetical protein